MYAIPKDQILDRLALENPWWQSPHQIQGDFARMRPRAYRDLFLPVVTERRVRRAVVLMGPRRVGKTVLLHHVVQQLLAAGTEPHRVCYVSVDHPLYVGCSLQRLLDLYAEASGVEPRRQPCWMIFDEIQYLKQWEVHLKALVDDYPKVRFIASGSAAAALRLKSHESGAGRFTDFLLPPLTFHEYLLLRGEDDLLEAGASALAGEELADDEMASINAAFIDYLNYGGYPEVALSPQIRSDPVRYVKGDIVDKVLLRDLPSLYGISDIQELNALFTTLAFNTAQEVSLEELSQNAGVSKPTLKRYVEYLEAAFLLKVVHRVDRGARRFKRANFFKVYLTNPSIRTALFAPITADDPATGALVETAVFAQWFHHQNHVRLHYARWRGGEVDMVSLGPAQRPEWAVEVKWSDRAARRPALLDRALDFCLRNNLPHLVVTTRTARRRLVRSNVLLDFVPAALHCLAVGRRIVEGSTDGSQLSLF